MVSQRLKALEALSRGTHWTIARQHELVKTDSGGMAGDEEAMAAAKQAREEERLRGLMGKAPGIRQAEGAPSGGQKGKKGKGNGKGKQEDSQKGKNQDGKKEDTSTTWQKKK